jgi:hypothetical protein
MEQDKEQDKQKMETQKPERKPDDTSGVHIQGHIKIFDPVTGEEFVNKRNAIHYENISVALAQNISNKSQSFIYEMHFGNGGTAVDPTGVISYLPPNTNAQNSNLYNPTYFKIVDDTSVKNTDPARNNITVLHTPGNIYTDILVTCLLDYGEPADQSAFDNSQSLNGDYVFDELGLKARSLDGSEGLTTTGLLLTHVVFHPVQKSLNRLIQIDYTVRIQTLTNLSSER